MSEQGIEFTPPISTLEIGEKKLHLTIVGKSEASPEHPNHNEDSFFILGRKAVGVFDGVGGMESGEKAATDACNFILEKLKTIQEPSFLSDVLTEANAKLAENYERSGTTASIVFLEGDKPTVVNVGDSRVYHLKIREGKLSQITLDDNQIRKMYPDEQKARAMQLKLNNTTNLGALSEQELMLFSKRNVITQCLGSGEIAPRIYTIENFAPGDIILVCTDGISDNLTDLQIQEILLHHQNSPQDAVNHLIEKAEEISKLGKERNPRSKKDDMTAVVIKAEESESKQKAGPGETVRESLSKQEKEEQRTLQAGDIVRVQRSSGKIEEGWKIIAIDEQRNKAVVVSPDYQLQKTIPLEKLLRLNHASPSDIPNAENFPELFCILKQIGGLSGTQKFYTPEELEKIINDVIAGNVAGIRGVTRTAGLRETVIRLLSKQTEQKAGLRETVRRLFSKQKKKVRV